MHKHMHMKTVLPYHILYITLNPGSISKARITAYANSKCLLATYISIMYAISVKICSKNQCRLNIYLEYFQFIYRAFWNICCMNLLL